MKDEKTVVLALLIVMTMITAGASVVAQIAGHPEPRIVTPAPPETTEARRGSELSAESPKPVVEPAPKPEFKRSAPAYAQAEMLLRKLCKAKGEELTQTYAELCRLIKEDAIAGQPVLEAHRTWQARQREAGKYDFFATEAIVKYEMDRHNQRAALKWLQDEMEIVRNGGLELGKYIDGTDVTNRDVVIADIQRRASLCFGR